MQNLDKIELLKELTPQERAGIASKCAWRTFGANEQILERSTDSRDMFFVVEGSVNIVNYGVSGREVTYASVGEGQYFGELSAIDGHARSANVVANTRCLLASLSPELFQELLMQNPAIMMSVLQRLVRIIRINDDRILDLSTLGAVQRVCQELLRMAEPDPVTANSWLIYPMPTQSVIASRVSTTRETVARVLGQLSHEGMVLKKGKTLYLKDKGAIEDYIKTLAMTSGQSGR
ncbi:Crp/Fnr family transcriptional regulator [uncultured Sneathiella sp.]|jgi:CRP-like cAMP-binding protein|uniref:Crp/Fnr family transcriptional regulator n=1 Tax=uncultured Sneathiella sp. TaxID=879315 RepID=UPI0030DB2E72|tara:strand:+ start:63 stop:764 length:702 start_codon:yes stop_codon:yes gene_type:complete